MRGKALLLAAAVFAGDRVTKLLIERSLELHQSIPVIGDLVRFTHVRNTGVVFGLLGRADHPLRGWPIAFISTLVLVVLVVYLWKVPPTRRLLQVSLGLVIGGAVGNLWDRVVLGYVTDYVDVSLAFLGFESRWPAFNVADAAICVGVALMAIDVWRGDKDEEQPRIP